MVRTRRDNAMLQVVFVGVWPPTENQSRGPPCTGKTRLVEVLIANFRFLCHALLPVDLVALLSLTTQLCWLNNFVYICLVIVVHIYVINQIVWITLVFRIFQQKLSKENNVIIDANSMDKMSICMNI